MEMMAADAIKAEVELNGMRQHVYLRLFHPASAWEYWEEDGKTGMALTFAKQGLQNRVEVQAGISYLSAEQALANLVKDNKGKSYDLIEPPPSSDGTTISAASRSKGEAKNSAQCSTPLFIGRS
ncbi:hypothetical protein [Paenibacillus sp. YN15]|uniref:hypothetical protein n=1 Tax=Paenibacillus sp. YN15 TaxID=1742774 RepID=UPI000DCB9BA5|nr:hypothetical protein [Paenibacillus sp. YN15]RAU92163.1 hypothetical protein DQG13_27995 [Paenibacillus sp. YN15]